MSRSERLELIRKIEEQTHSRLIVYITGDRRGLETKISSDVFPFVFDHLSRFGEVEKVNIFLYTTGGITISGFALVNMIREFCDDLGVIIPFKALSTGTLIVLGANTIIMSKMGQLGPVDPSLNHPLAPTVPLPQNPNLKAAVPVNVEDVVSYFDLAKKEASVKSENELADVFKMLSNGIHPLVLGAVNRARNQIKFLARMLLNYHLSDPVKVDKVIRTLLEERFSHDYIVGRKEAKKDLGLNILEVTQELNNLVMNLYDEYNSLLRLNTQYVPEVELGTKEQSTITFYRGIIESNNLTHVYTTQRKITRIQVQQPGTPITIPQYLENTIQEGWLENNAI
jgi:hypothetical protein